MPFSLFKSQRKLGIDIGTASIKAIELEKKDSRFNLTNYGLFEFKGSKNAASGDENILKLPDSEIIWGVKEMLKRAKISTKDVVASIPSFSTFATMIEIPYLSEEELAKAIPFEAKKYVPLPLDEVVYDWSIIETTPQTGKAPTVSVFLAAIPKEDALRYQTIMKESGLNLLALELENSALIRSLLGNDLSPTALINIGGRSTSIIIVNRGYERLSHNYEIGGFEITRSISRSLNVSLEKAEDLKRKMGLKETDENVVNKAMVSLIDMMAFETQKTITHYEEAKKQSVSRILLVGGLANMPHFKEYFEKKLGRPIVTGNALARVISSPHIQPLIGEISNTFAVALGLAMRES
ncbi:MAG TPA: type IV pilus assembly protein PilM [Candidatus Paceibacterota bacterium]